jgi:hypothetical protein
MACYRENFIIVSSSSCSSSSPTTTLETHFCSLITGTLYVWIVVFFVQLVCFPHFKFEVYFICKQIFHFWKHILLCLSLLEYTEQMSLFSANECLLYKITTNFWLVNTYCLSHLFTYTLTQFIHYIVHHHQLWGYLLPWFFYTLRTGIFFLYIYHKSLIQSKVTFLKKRWPGWTIFFAPSIV